MVELKMNSLRQLPAITKCISLVVSIICLALYFKYGGAVIAFDSISTIRFAACITPSTVFVLFYDLVQYVFAENEPGKHLVSNVVFSFPFALFHFSLGITIFKADFNRILDYLNMYGIDKGDVLASGVIYILTGVALFIDGVVAVIKRN